MRFSVYFSKIPVCSLFLSCVSDGLPWVWIVLAIVRWFDVEALYFLPIVLRWSAWFILDRGMDTLICKKLLVELYELCLFLFYYFGGVHWNIVYIEYILTICKYSLTRRRKYLTKWTINMDIDKNNRCNHQSSWGY